MGEQIETGGLAGAVGPDQRVNSATAHGKIDAVDRHEAFELLGESTRLQNDVVGHACPVAAAPSAGVARLSGTRAELATRLGVPEPQEGHFGGRLSTNASMPSLASGSSALQAITSPAKS